MYKLVIVIGILLSLSACAHVPARAHTAREELDRAIYLQETHESEIGEMYYSQVK